MEPHEKPIIIFDTDMDTDCDDAGAFAVLLEAHRLGKIDLVGAVSDSVCKYAAPCCEVISGFYNVDFPIGAVYADDYKDTQKNIQRFAPYREHSEKCYVNGRSYNRVFAKQINKIDKNYPSAATVYRKLLADAQDNSVTVLCVGMLTAVAEALCTKADESSPLSGQELFRKKVKCVVTMGEPDYADDFNWGMDAYASEQFFSLCPVPVYISSEGTNIITGEHLTSALNNEHPLRRAYEIWLRKENCGRSSWDLIAALFAIAPDFPYFACNDYGNFEYSADKKCLYKSANGAECKRIGLNCEPHQMEILLNNCMLGYFDNI